MPGIGETLREARVRQRVNIEELERSTKIRAKYLRALENEEFGLLPGPTYVKSFLRTYAEKLGLDAQLLVEEFRAQYEEPEPVELQPLAAPPRGPLRRPPTPRVGPGAAIAAAAVALLAFLLILGLTGDDDEEPRPAGEAGGGTTTAAEERPARRNRPEPATPQRVRMRVIPALATYVCVDRGPDRPVFEGILDAPQTFQARDMLRVNLGKRSAQLRVNGRRVPFPDGPDPVGFAFTRDGEREELPAGERPCA